MNCAPNGCRTSSINGSALPYFLDTAGLPEISRVISSAKMQVTYPMAFAQQWNARVTISQLDLMAGLILMPEGTFPACQRRLRQMRWLSGL